MMHPGGVATLLLALGGCGGDSTGLASSNGTEPVRIRPSVAPAAPATPASSEPGARPAALTDEPRHPRTAAEAAEQIVAAEAALADPSSSAPVLRAAGETQQLAYRSLGEHPGWDAQARAAVPARLRSLVRHNVSARREFRSMHTTPAGTLPAWRIVAPAPARTLMTAYRTAQRRTDVGWEYLAAINLVETGIGRIRGTSSAGAQGPMQFLPGTWERWGAGGDIDSPRDSILAAGRFLAGQGFTRPGGIAGALYRYNNSAAYVRGVTLLARIMAHRPSAFVGYYHWRIYYLTRRGDVLLPEGYDAAQPVPVDDYLAEHPQR